MNDELTFNSDELDHLWNTINKYPLDRFSSWISLTNLLFAIIGSISNFMSVIVLFKLSHQLSTFIYLTSLSISDMITCLTIMSIEFVEIFLQTRRTRLITKFFRQIEILCGALAAASRVLSLWISTAVTIDRWMLICHPISGKHFCTLKRARIVSRMLFFIAFLYSIPLCFEYEIIELPSVNQMIEFNNQTRSINSLNENSMLITKGYSDLAKRRFYRWFYMFFNAIFVYICPTTTIVCLNLQLIRSLHRLKSRMKQFQQKNPMKKSSTHQSKYSITIMVIAMVIALLLCRSPTIVLWILWSFERTIKTFFDSSIGSFVRRYHQVANLIALINAATNFIPFCVFGQLFRESCLTTYCCRKLTSEQLAQQAKYQYRQQRKKTSLKFNKKNSNNQLLTHVEQGGLSTMPSFYSDPISGITPSSIEQSDLNGQTNICSSSLYATSFL